MLRGCGQGFLFVMSFDDLMLEWPETRLPCIQNIILIIDQQDSRRHGYPASGSSTRKVVPTPAFEVKLILPPWASSMEWQYVRPNPSPPVFWVANCLNILG